MPRCAASAKRAVARVDERHDLVAEIRVVVADAGRVEELRAAVRRPRVDEDDERGRAALVGEERVDELEHVRAERRAVAPHVELAGVPLDQVDRRAAASRRRPAACRPRAAAGAGRRAGCRGARRSRARARRGVPTRSLDHGCTARFFHWAVPPRGYSRRVARRLGIVLARRARRGRLRRPQLEAVHREGVGAVPQEQRLHRRDDEPRARSGFIAGFADNGGIRATSPLPETCSRSPSRRAPTPWPRPRRPSSSHAPKSLRPHISDIMSANRNAVLVWTMTPNRRRADAATRCLKG